MIRGLLFRAKSCLPWAKILPKNKLTKLPLDRLQLLIIYMYG